MKTLLTFILALIGLTCYPSQPPPFRYNPFTTNQGAVFDLKSQTVSNATYYGDGSHLEGVASAGGITNHSTNITLDGVFSGRFSGDVWGYNTRPSVFEFGAHGDSILVTNVNMTATETNVYCYFANWTLADVGKKIEVVGAGIAFPGGTTKSNLMSTIATVVESTNVSIRAAAATSVANSIAAYGNDDTPAFQSAITYQDTNPGTVYVPSGYNYLIDGEFQALPNSGNAHSQLVLPTNGFYGLGKTFSLKGTAPPYGSLGQVGATLHCFRSPPLIASNYCVIGWPDFYDLNIGGWGFNLQELDLENLSFLTSPDSPNSVVQVSRLGRAGLYNCTFTAWFQALESNPTNYFLHRPAYYIPAVWMPTYTSDMKAELISCTAYGFGIGFMGAEHLIAQGLQVGFCTSGFGLDRAGHGPVINRLDVFYCTTNLTFIPWLTTAPDQGAWVEIFGLDWEQNGDVGSWHRMVRNIYDPGQRIVGKIVTKASIGSSDVVGPLLGIEYLGGPEMGNISSARFALAYDGGLTGWGFHLGSSALTTENFNIAEEGSHTWTIMQAQSVGAELALGHANASPHAMSLFHTNVLVRTNISILGQLAVTNGIALMAVTNVTGSAVKGQIPIKVNGSTYYIDLKQ